MGHVQRLSRDPSQASVLFLSVSIFGKPMEFIVDSGAEKSVLPCEVAPWTLVQPTSTTLSGINGSTIKTYGQCCAEISVSKLRRCFKINFIVTNTIGILGADFLSAHNLSLNMKQRHLSDLTTGLKATLEPGSICKPSILVTNASQDNDIITREFPSLSDAPDYTSMPVSFEVTHAIETSCPPIYCKARPLNPTKLASAEKEFNKLLDLKIIRPSNSPWASPLHMVPKTDGTWRPCGDYRRLNAVTTPDRYAVPNMQHIHHKLHGSKFFSTLDLTKAYHFIPMHEADIPKTAISTPFGTFEYLRMPFGLRNASSTFQRYMDSVFRDFGFVVTYIDDILVFSKNEEEHLQHLRQVCSRLSSIGLKVNKSKCSLMQTTVNFLGYELNTNGIKPMKSRIQALLDLPPPTDAKTLQRYLGMTGFYQRCVPHYSDIVQPLRSLLNSSAFNWTECHESSFNSIKHKIAEATELAYPSPDAAFTITSDASAVAIGACLHQVKDGLSSPLAFFSRKLSETECRYSTFDRELLAAYAAVRKWKDFFCGSSLTIFTDHKPLVGAFKSGRERPSDRQQRHLSLLNEFATDIVYVAGKENVVADTLSRSFSNVLSAVSASKIKSFDLISLAKNQIGLSFDGHNVKEFPVGVKDLKLSCEVSHVNPRPFVPENLRRDVFDFFHGMSHPGRKPTTKIIGSRYFWPNMKADLQRWVSECIACQSGKIHRHTHRPLAELPCPSQRFTSVHMDIVGPLDNQPGQARYLLTIIDSFSRWVEVFPLHDISAESVSDAFLFQWVARFGPPLTLTTDRGTQFMSEIMSIVNTILGINHIRTCAYNPKANGIIERFHRSLKASLRCHGGNWLKSLPMVLLGLRMAPDEQGNSAFSRLTGEQPIIPQVLPTNMDVNDLCEKLQKIHYSYQPTRSRKVTAHTPKELHTADFVWLRLDRVKKPTEAPYQGPFRVLNRHPDVFTIEVKGHPVTVSIERLKPAVLPKNTCPKIQRKEEAESEPTVPPPIDTQEVRQTRSGRKLRFKEDTQYIYF